ncbi:hypothetical protein HYW76_03850 [Candidatus Pacearchaeota archaeon]|nr:hypothetical protein [Candidatus Pacearchaeota archaeon]
MEQRKLIRLGNSSFAIALPKDWVDKSGLKKGDNIFLEKNNNGEIVVSPKFKEINEEKETTINLSEKEEKEIARDIISAYTSGHKIIKVQGEKSQMNIAKEVTKSFLNLELIDENEKEVMFKELLDIENIDIQRFIKRMDNNLKEMFSILRSIKKNNKNIKEKYKEIEAIDKDVTKFYFLIWRLMNMGIDNPAIQSNFKLDSRSFFVFFWISYNLEQIGDEIKRIARKVEKFDDEGLAVYENTLLLTIENYEKSSQSFFQKDKTLSKEIILKKGDIVKICDRLSEFKSFGAVAEKFHRINDNIYNNSKMIFYQL